MSIVLRDTIGRCGGGWSMPRALREDTARIGFRVGPADKAKLMRASALEDADLTDFILRTALRAADDVIAKAEQVKLTERDSLRVLDLLENPPAPNARLMAAARALPAKR
ncbi:DUF1778 domain-containing protein [Nitrospirillum sp. BR 11828]|uniref:type II toxin-antitoxin system TacA family antitoxin n=1 Tax=Nitrospirillum sp. BR 11828 TaxID=3104325 RepID=UPI002ACAC0B6|nr:DUF1778 domain-containing protein [Nitrospirillum sp. BR 11828]MDZ5646062.1 DUF1778 domain-containing protein [Nitrospirillum sp. BR 11828]